MEMHAPIVSRCMRGVRVPLAARRGCVLLSRRGRVLRSRRGRLLLGPLLALAALLALSPAAASAAAITPEATDVMFVFDTSGSMGGELEEAKAEIVSVMEHINATLPNAEYAVSEVRDYSPSLYDEEEGVLPWKLDQPLTPDLGAVRASIEPLEATGGGDEPESYGRALWESDTNPNVGWRSGARHVIILVADNVPHDGNLDEGIAESLWVESSPWNTGEELPGTWNIPGTQWVAGTNLDFQAIMKQLALDGKPLQAVEFYGAENGYLPYWEYWASLSGGQALNGLSGELATKLTALIEKGATTTLPPCPEGEERDASGVCAAPSGGEPGAHLSEVKLSHKGTIGKGGAVEVPVECGFPCIVEGQLLSGPDLGKLSSFARPALLASPFAAHVAARHRKKHGKRHGKKPAVLGKGKLTIKTGGKGTLVIKPSRKARRALKRRGKRGARLTLKVRVHTLDGTLVGTKTQRVKLREAKRKKH